MDPTKKGEGDGSDEDDGEEEEEDQEDEESDEESDDEEKDAPLTKGQAKQFIADLLSETIRRQGGFSGQGGSSSKGKKPKKHSKKRVANVQKEKDADRKWQRLAFCVSFIEYLVDIARQ